MTWMQELEQTARFNPHVVLTGQTSDRVILDDDESPDGGIRVVPFERSLLELADRIGFAFVVVAHPVFGCQIAVPESNDDASVDLPEPLASLPRFAPGLPAMANRRASAGELAEALQLAASSPRPGAVLVLDAGRWIVDPANLSEEEHRLFVLAAAIADRSLPRRTRHGGQAHPLVWWLCRSAYELPAWYVSGTGVRTVDVPGPDLHQRQRVGAALLAPERAEVFAASTDGLSVRELDAVVDLVESGRGIPEAATLVRLGVVDDPWLSPDLRERLQGGQARLGERVRGQAQAVATAWSTIARSVEDLSGVHRGRRSRRPRVVLFCAGPTGTGKTELAKAVARLIFGSEEALITFDMSGYAAEHSVQRLVGAPPGFVGHEAGGELTNAVRARPFSVILFDEFEKAHPRLFDIFLQILDEGRLDDGLGRRVHFDQTVVMFTSNLGVAERRRREDGSSMVVQLVNDEMTFEEIDQTVRRTIDRHFHEVLTRGEILNRLGDNIVVFDFLRPGPAGEVFDHLVANVVAGVAERRGIELVIDDRVREQLRRLCCRASSRFGGRGIENKLESTLVNPLAVALSAAPRPPGSRVRAVGWEDGDPPRLELEDA